MRKLKFNQTAICAGAAILAALSIGCSQSADSEAEAETVDGDPAVVERSGMSANSV